ncbi:Neuroendocrine convertase 1 [Thelohanellus kitauei]|uniref:Neuroendocrine convertase 1 n=1 Tax=Thelohanellus kitauei TaxID=669202 RepID=A0A0C2M6M8_THEKT|nr:Neuroendocrine convertase 1 [Thelohanellus kitauei]
MLRIYGCVTVNRIGGKPDLVDGSWKESYYVCQRNYSPISDKHVLALSKSDSRIREVFFDAKSIRSKRLTFNDPGYAEQSLYSGQQGDGEDTTIYSHNLYNLWKRGITGKGIVVAVVDDGVDRYHEDLKGNYDPKASYNFVTDTYDPNTLNDSHGTKCIGLISSVANNRICGVGAAYEAKFGALRVFSSEHLEIYDSHEAQAFQFKPDYIDVYSMSWGPLDDGKSIEKPNALASAALEYAAVHGRKGKGSLFIWSTGNGGRNFDSCGYDGYLQRHEVLVVSSASTKGSVPLYAERCTAVIACSLSNYGNYPEPLIYTTFPPNKCSRSHAGTSVSAPIVSAIIALLLQTKNDLSRRDIQDLIVRTSLQIDKHFIVNAAGHKHSLNFGFGLIQADKLIDAANSSDFKTLPPLKICKSPILNDGQQVISGGWLNSSIYTSGCLRGPSTLDTIEVVIVTLTIESSLRSGSTIFLTSPSGTTAPILEPRYMDTSGEMLNSWDIKIMTFYDEKAYGEWKLRILVPRHLKTKLVSWGIRVYGILRSPDSVHHQDAIKKIMCNKKMLVTDEYIINWCAGKPLNERESDQKDLDRLALIDSKYLRDLHRLKTKKRVSWLVVVLPVVVLCFVSLVLIYIRFFRSRTISFRLIDYQY